MLGSYTVHNPGNHSPKLFDYDYEYDYEYRFAEYAYE
jgi:hypothetical protein